MVVLNRLFLNFGSWLVLCSELVLISSGMLVFLQLCLLVCRLIMNWVRVWCRCVIGLCRMVKCELDSLVVVLLFSQLLWVFSLMWLSILKLNWCGVFQCVCFMLLFLLVLVGMLLVGRFGMFIEIVLIFLCSLFSVIFEVFSLLVKVVILVMMVDMFLFLVLVWLMVLEWLLCRFCSFWVCIWMCL